MAAAQRGGIGLGWWAALVVLAVLTLCGCVTVPHLGWSGWALLVVVYFVARRAGQLEERVAQVEAGRDADELPEWPDADRMHRAISRANDTDDAGDAVGRLAVRLMVYAVAESLALKPAASDADVTAKAVASAPAGVHRSWRRGMFNAETLRPQVSLVASVMRVVTAKHVAAGMARRPPPPSSEIVGTATEEIFARYDALDEGSEQDVTVIALMCAALVDRYARQSQERGDPAAWFADFYEAEAKRQPRITAT